tara:strand:+ start:55 stop:441 length:387 start_codon:yes stop_codon:yes gene_type:complete
LPLFRVCFNDTKGRVDLEAVASLHKIRAEQTQQTKENKMKIINDRLNLGQAMDIKKISKIIINNHKKENSSDFMKLINSVYDIKELDLKDTKKSKYYLSNLIYHITCYALENENFKKVFQIENDKSIK